MGPVDSEVVRGGGKEADVQHVGGRGAEAVMCTCKDVSQVSQLVLGAADRGASGRQACFSFLLGNCIERRPDVRASAPPGREGVLPKRPCCHLTSVY